MFILYLYESPDFNFLIKLKQLFFNSVASQVVLVVKNPPANAGDIRDAGAIPE